MTLRIRWSRSVFIVPLLLVATRKAKAETTNFRVKGNTATALPEAADPLDPCFLFVAHRTWSIRSYLVAVLPMRARCSRSIKQTSALMSFSSKARGEYQVCLTATRMHRVTIVTAQIREDLFTCIAELSEVGHTLACLAPTDC
jgi:hypothetical protein